MVFFYDQLAVAHNILLIATSTVVVVMVVVFIYICGGIHSSWILWLNSCEQVYMWVLLRSSIAANAYKLVSKCDCSKQRLTIELRVHGKKFNGMPLGKLHLLAAACTPMAAVQVLTGYNLRWWSFLQPLSAFTFWHMWWCEWCACMCWHGAIVTCTGGLFL